MNRYEIEFFDEANTHARFQVSAPDPRAAQEAARAQLWAVAPPRVQARIDQLAVKVELVEEGV